MVHHNSSRFAFPLTCSISNQKIGGKLCKTILQQGTDLRYQTPAAPRQQQQQVWRVRLPACQDQDQHPRGLAARQFAVTSALPTWKSKIVVSDTQSDSIQFLNFAKKWFIHLWGRLGILLQRENAAILGNRIPNFPPPQIDGLNEWKIMIYHLNCTVSDTIKYAFTWNISI